MNGIINFSLNVVSAAQNVRANVRERITCAGRSYRIGHRTYQEVRKLSEGGFAFVVVVRDIVDNREFALKKVLCQDKERYLAARNEVDIIANLAEHPHIVSYRGSTIVSSTSHNGSPQREVCILLELCRGGHLLQLLDSKKGKLGEDTIVRILADVVKGLCHLHQQDPPISHRDLKIENILCSNGVYKICDFGSCTKGTVEMKSCGRDQVLRLQEEIELYTTMMYRPPEMVDLYKGYAVSSKVDIWMLGCVLYTLVFYRHPFQDQCALAIANANYSLPLEMLREGSNSRVSNKLLNLMHWMLAAHPNDRPAAEELDRILSKYQKISPTALDSYIPNVVLEKAIRLTTEAKLQEQPVVYEPISIVPLTPATSANKSYSKNKKTPPVHLPPKAAVTMWSEPNHSVDEQWIAFDDDTSASAVFYPKKENASSTVTAATVVPTRTVWDFFESESPTYPVVEETVPPPSQVNSPRKLGNNATSSFSDSDCLMLL